MSLKISSEIGELIAGKEAEEEILSVNNRSARNLRHWKHTPLPGTKRGTPTIPALQLAQEPLGVS